MPMCDYKPKRMSIAVFVVAMTLAGTALAGPLEDAAAAYATGDYATTLRISRQLADQGNALAQDVLGNLYAIGKGVQQDYAEAARWYRRAAEQGHPVGQLNLSGLYYYGYGAPQDYVESYKWLHLAVSRFPRGETYRRDVAINTRDILARSITQHRLPRRRNLRVDGSPSSGHGARIRSRWQQCAPRWAAASEARDR